MAIHCLRLDIGDLSGRVYAGNPTSHLHWCCWPQPSHRTRILQPFTPFDPAQAHFVSSTDRGPLYLKQATDDNCRYPPENGHFRVDHSASPHV